MVGVSRRIQLYHSLQTRKLGAKPDTLTRRSDVYPSGEGAYARTNAHNIHTIIKSSQLLASFILDNAVVLSLIREGIKEDEFAQKLVSILHCPRLPPGSTP